MATDRTANVVWQGDLMNGGGTIESVTSSAFAPLDVSWASRSEEPNGKTSPEELIAAAWASCFSMALSGSVPGMDGDALIEAAEAAKQNCPVSKALTGIPETSLVASLA